MNTVETYRQMIHQHIRERALFLNSIRELIEILDLPFLDRSETKIKLLEAGFNQTEADLIWSWL